MINQAASTGQRPSQAHLNAVQAASRVRPPILSIHRPTGIIHRPVGNIHRSPQSKQLRVCVHLFSLPATAPAACHQTACYRKKSTVVVKLLFVGSLVTGSARMYSSKDDIFPLLAARKEYARCTSNDPAERRDGRFLNATPFPSSQDDLSPRPRDELPEPHHGPSGRRRRQGFHELGAPAARNLHCRPCHRCRRDAVAFVV